MKFGKNIKSSAAAIVLLSTALVAHSAPTFFFGSAPNAGGVFPTEPPASPPLQQQAAFKNLVNSGRLTETFENSTSGALSFSGDSLSIFGNSGTVLQAEIPGTGDYQGGYVKSGTRSNGRFNTTDGAASGKWFESDWGFSLRLGSAVAAFGFYGTDFGDFDGNLVIELYDGVNLRLANAFTDGAGAPLNPGAAIDGSLMFFGFASDTFKFDRIVFKINQGAGIGGNFDTLGFDDIMIGNMSAGGGTVPEPASLALVGMALVGLGISRARRSV